MWVMASIKCGCLPSGYLFIYRDGCVLRFKTLQFPRGDQTEVLALTYFWQTFGNEWNYTKKGERFPSTQRLKIKFTPCGKFRQFLLFFKHSENSNLLERINLLTFEYWIRFEWNKHICMYVHWRIYSSRDLDTLLHKVDLLNEYIGKYTGIYTHATIAWAKWDDTCERQDV